MEPTLLSERLERLADRSAPPAREDLAEVVAGLHRARRREAAGMLAICAAVAAVVLLVPQLLDRGPAPAPAAPVTTPSSDADVLGQPTRGSLAGDGAYVDAVRALPWTESDNPESPTAGVEPPVESRHVVFAGDVPGARWALVAAPGSTEPALTDGVVAVWFVGPVGAAPEQLQPASLLSGTRPADPVALSDAASGAVVVVGAPGDEIAISRRPDVAPDGAISRSWEQVEAPDGVAVLELPAPAGVYDEALRYRVSRDGTEVVTAMPSGFRTGDYSPPDVTLTWLRDPPGGSSADPILRSTAYEIVGRTGLSTEEISFGVLWAGDLPASDGGSAQVQLLTATFPAGATYVEARVSHDVGGASVASSWCGTELRPSGRPPAEQTFAVRCDVTDFSRDGEVVSSLVVVAPPTAVRARALDADGDTLAEFALTDGAAVVPAQDGAVSVQALAANGSTVDEQPLMGVVDWDEE